MALILAVSVAWVTVALAHMSRLWLWSSIVPFTRWVPGLTELVAGGVLGLAWLVAITVTAMVMVALRRTHRSLGCRPGPGWSTVPSAMPTSATPGRCDRRLPDLAMRVPPAGASLPVTISRSTITFCSLRVPRS